MVTYADRPWVKKYDPDVPESLVPYPDHSLHEFLRQSAQKFPNRTLTLSSAKLPVIGRVKNELTYRQVDMYSDALAQAFIDMGLKKGDRVGIVMPNIAQFVITFYAILKAGGVVVALNPTYPPMRLRDMIKDAGPEIIVCMSMFYDMLKKIQGETPVKTMIVTNVKEYLHPVARTLFTIAREKKEGHRVTIQSGDHDFQDVLKRYAGRRPNIAIKGDDLALFQYTGGTTGVSKAAMATHSALVANCLMCRAWLATDGPGEEEIFLAAIPLFHVFGMVAVMSFAVSMGSKMVMVPNARDIDDVIENVHTYRSTLFMGVPALYNAINQNERVKTGEIDLHSIRACISGSAPLPPATKRDFEANTGGKLLEGFGMSEAPTATHCNPLHGENRVGSIGLPFPDMDMKIVSLDDQEVEMPVGEPGELCMVGPQIMKGYFGMPTETENALRKHADGKTWLHTGDIGRMDEDGYFYIVDRKKDMALIGGYNVYPRKVEDILNEHPAVLEVGVAAIPHPEKEGQEALKAWIVIKPSETLTEKELMAFCEDKLARYETPSRYTFVEELPKTTVGKILRRELVRLELEAREKAES